MKIGISTSVIQRGKTGIAHYLFSLLAEMIGRARKIARRSGPSTDEKDDAFSRIARLTERQQQVLYGIAAGEANKTIANRLGISVRTVETYRAQLCRPARSVVAVSAARCRPYWCLRPLRLLRRRRRLHRHSRRPRSSTLQPAG